jgi:flagellar hook assembly protein FlgD
MVKNSQYNLHVYPNPFTHNIKISFSVGHNAKGIEQRVEGTELKIYDATGRLIKSFSHVTNQIFDQVVWDGRDDAGKKLPSGVYFLKFQAGDYTATEKLILLR